jgi:hypothetical protein
VTNAPWPPEKIVWQFPIESIRERPDFGFALLELTIGSITEPAGALMATIGGVCASMFILLTDRDNFGLVSGECSAIDRRSGGTAVPLVIAVDS